MSLKKLIYSSFTALAIIIGCSNCTEDDPITSEDVVYDPDVSNVMFNFCTTCHSGSAPSANLDLSSYNNVKQAAESGNLLDRINDSSDPMPPSGLLSEERRTLLDNWASGGYKEN